MKILKIAGILCLSFLFLIGCGAEEENFTLINHTEHSFQSIELKTSSTIETLSMPDGTVIDPDMSCSVWIPPVDGMELEVTLMNEDGEQIGNFVQEMTFENEELEVELVETENGYTLQPVD